MRKLLKMALAAAICASAFAPGAMTGSAAAHEPYFREAPSPECASPRLLKSIMNRFRIQARQVHHQPDLKILEIHRVHQTRFLPQDVHLDRPIERRYCKGHVHLSDGRQRTIWYLIEGGMGFASLGSSVEFCISGLDDWNVYDAHCRVLR